MKVYIVIRDAAFMGLFLWAISILIGIEVHAYNTQYYAERAAFAAMAIEDRWHK